MFALRAVRVLGNAHATDGQVSKLGGLTLGQNLFALDPSRGLIFGLTRAIAEQHVFEYGRTGRALNVAMTSGLPVIGMDAATGATFVRNDDWWGGKPLLDGVELVFSDDPATQIQGLLGEVEVLANRVGAGGAALILHKGCVRVGRIACPRTDPLKP